MASVVFPLCRSLSSLSAALKPCSVWKHTAASMCTASAKTHSRVAVLGTGAPAVAERLAATNPALDVSVGLQGGGSDVVDAVALVGHGLVADSAHALPALRQRVSSAFQGPMPTIVEVGCSRLVGSPKSTDPSTTAALLADALHEPHPRLKTLQRLQLRAVPPPFQNRDIFTAVGMHHVRLLRHPTPNPLNMDVVVNDYKPTNVVADGIVILTPRGSQVFATRSKAMTLDTRLPVVQLAALAPTSLSFRPLVLPDSVRFSINMRALRFGRKLTLQVDGESFLLPAHDEFIITRAVHPYQFISLQT